MLIMKILRTSVTLAGLILLGFPGNAETVTEPVQPVLKNPIQAVVPLPLLNTHMADPRVIAKVQVNSLGEVDDLVVIDAAHIGLIQRAENLIRNAEIVTGELESDQSVRFDFNLPFLYPADLGLQMKTPMDDVEIMLETVKHTDFEVHLHMPNELDNPPRLLDRGQIYMPTDADGVTIVGEAKVEFYVNHLGEVRLPRILSSTHDEVSKAAIASVRDMKFEPPMVDGSPMVTVVRMPFKTN